MPKTSGLTGAQVDKLIADLESLRDLAVEAFDSGADEDDECDSPAECHAAAKTFAYGRARQLVRQAAGRIPQRAGVPAEPVSAAEVADVPLRRLVLRVVQPGTQVTVTDVMERLAAIGSRWTASSVSNALGYLVRRGQLVREQRGTYSRPGAS